MSVDGVACDFRLRDMSEDEIDQLESRVPALSGQAFAAARQRALASGLSVLETENGILFEVFPNGRKVPIKAVPRQTLVSGFWFSI